MKKSILLTSIMLISLWINSKSQTYTPTGVPVLTFDLSPISSEVSYKRAIDSLIQIYNWDAKVIGPIDASYNCHGYAWHVADGGNKVSIGDPFPYYNTATGNAAYVLTSNDDKDTLRKIYYSGANHSAITTKTLDVVISKWGPGYLVRHKVNDCPYNLDYYGNPTTPYHLEYYKLKTNGDNTVMVGSTASVSTLNISGAVYTWSGNENYICAAGSTSTGSVTGINTTLQYGPAAKAYVSIYSPISKTTVTGDWSLTVTPAGATPYITGYTLVCSSGRSFLLNNLPAGNTITWTSSANLSTTNNHANPCTFTAIDNGSGWVKATLSTPCSSGIIPVNQFSTWVGAPVFSSINGPSSTPNNKYATFYVDANPNAAITQYTWNLNPLNGNSLYPSSRYLDIAFHNTGNYQLLIKGQNTCGTGPNFWRGVYVYNSTSLAISPNPASTSVILTLVNNETMATPDSTSSSAKVAIADVQTKYNVSVCNNYGTKFLSLQKTGSSFSLPIGNLPNGTYIVSVSDDKNSYSSQLIVKH